MEELSKTYTLTHSRDGWRVNFSTGLAPGFGLEPQYSLFDVIDRNAAPRVPPIPQKEKRTGLCHLSRPREPFCGT